MARTKKKLQVQGHKILQIQKEPLAQESKEPQSWPNNIATEYKTYYRGGKEKSLYSQQYNDDVLPRDKQIIGEEVFKIKKGRKPEILPIDNLASSIEQVVPSGDENEVTILDYGAGNGRYWETIKDVAAKLKDKGIKLKLLALDVSLEGLETFNEERVLVDGFKETEYSKENKAPDLHAIDDLANSINAPGYKGKSFCRDNLTVEFIHTNVNDSAKHIASLTGQVDITMSMFGVLSHIPYRKERQKAFKLLNEITNPEGSVIITLPGPSRFQRENSAYNLMREHRQFDLLKFAKEPGDIFYAKFNASNDMSRIYYHIYNTKEFLDDLQAGGLIPENGIQIANIVDIKTLAKHPWIAKVDEYVSWAASKFTPKTWVNRVVDSLSSYELAVAKPTR